MFPRLPRGMTALLGAIACTAAAADPDLTGLWHGHGLHIRRGVYTTHVALSRATGGEWSVAGQITYGDGRMASYVGVLGAGARPVGTYTSSRDRGSLHAVVLEGRGEIVLYLRWSGQEKGAGWERLSRSGVPAPQPSATALERELAGAFELDRLPLEPDVRRDEPPAEAAPDRVDPPADRPSTVSAPPPVAPPSATPPAAPGQEPEEKKAEEEEEDDFAGHLATPLVLEGSGQHLEIEGRGLRPGIELRVRGGAAVSGGVRYEADGTAMSVDIAAALEAGRFHALELVRRGGKRPPKAVGELAVLRLRAEQEEVVLPSRWSGGVGGTRLLVEPRGALDGERGQALLLTCQAVEPTDPVGSPLQEVWSRPRLEGVDTARFEPDAHGGAITTQIDPSWSDESSENRVWTLSARIAPRRTARTFQARELQRLVTTPLSIVDFSETAYPQHERMMKYTLFSRQFSTVIPFRANHDRFWAAYSLERLRMQYVDTFAKSSDLIDADRCPLLKGSPVKSYSKNGRVHKAYIIKNVRKYIREVPMIVFNKITLHFSMATDSLQFVAYTKLMYIREIIGSHTLFGNIDSIADMSYRKADATRDLSKMLTTPVSHTSNIAGFLRKHGIASETSVLNTCVVMAHNHLNKDEYFHKNSSDGGILGQTTPLSYNHDIVFDQNLTQFLGGNLNQYSYAQSTLEYQSQSDFKSRVNKPITFGVSSRELIVVERAFDKTITFVPQPTTYTKFISVKSALVSNMNVTEDISLMIDDYRDSVATTGRRLKVVNTGMSMFGFFFSVTPAVGYVKFAMSLLSTMTAAKAAELAQMDELIRFFMGLLATPDGNGTLQMKSDFACVVTSGTFSRHDVVNGKVLQFNKSTNKSFYNFREGNFVLDEESCEAMSFTNPDRRWFTFGVSARQTLAIDERLLDAYSALYQKLEATRDSNVDTWFVDREQLTRHLARLRELSITAEMSTAVVDMADPDDGIVWVRWTK